MRVQDCAPVECAAPGGSSDPDAISDPDASSSGQPTTAAAAAAARPERTGRTAAARIELTIAPRASCMPISASHACLARCRSCSMAVCFSSRRTARSSESMWDSRTRRSWRAGPARISRIKLARSSSATIEVRARSSSSRVAARVVADMNRMGDGAARPRLCSETDEPRARGLRRLPSPPTTSSGYAAPTGAKKLTLGPPAREAATAAAPRPAR